MAQLTIQPSINDERGRALLELIGRMDALDLVPILVYRLDSVPDSALLRLAWQFDLVAPQWQLGAQVSESIDALAAIDPLIDVDTLSSTGGVAGSSDFDSLRALLKVAIPLHRTRGTPYAIKAALTPPGWPEDDIKLIVPLYDRHFLHSGITYGANEPAVADSGVTVNGVAIAAKH